MTWITVQYLRSAQIYSTRPRLHFGRHTTVAFITVCPPPAADLVEKLAHDRLFFFSLDCDLFHVHEANIGTQ